MPKRKGKHLTWNDRLTIEKMLREGYSNAPDRSAILACITAPSTTSAGGEKRSC